MREHSLNEGLLLSAMDELNELEVAHQKHSVSLPVGKARPVQLLAKKASSAPST